MKCNAEAQATERVATQERRKGRQVSVIECARVIQGRQNGPDILEDLLR